MLFIPGSSSPELQLAISKVGLMFNVLSEGLEIMDQLLRWHKQTVRYLDDTEFSHP